MMKCHSAAFRLLAGFLGLLLIIATHAVRAEASRQRRQGAN
jgi:hypothetical protein